MIHAVEGEVVVVEALLLIFARRCLNVLGNGFQFNSFALGGFLLLRRNSILLYLWVFINYIKILNRTFSLL